MSAISLKNISLSVREYLVQASANFCRLSRRCYFGVFFGLPSSLSDISASLVISGTPAVLENLFNPSFFFSFSSLSMCFLINSSISSPYSPLLESSATAAFMFGLALAAATYILVLIGGFIKASRNSESFLEFPALSVLDVRLYSSSKILSSSSSSSQDPIESFRGCCFEVEEVAVSLLSSGLPSKSSSQFSSIVAVGLVVNFPIALSSSVKRS